MQIPEENFRANDFSTLEHPKISKMFKEESTVSISAMSASLIRKTFKELGSYGNLII